MGSDTAFLRAIRAATIRLPYMLPSFHKIITQEINAALALSNDTEGESKVVQLSELVRSMQTRLNILFLLGDNLGEECEPNLL